MGNLISKKIHEEIQKTEAMKQSLSLYAQLSMKRSYRVGNILNKTANQLIGMRQIVLI